MADSPNQTIKHELPPSDIDAEKALLGSILLNSQILQDVADKLHSEYFYDPRHQIIYTAMIELWSSNKPIDIISTLDHIKNSPLKKGETAIDKEFILDLVSKTSLSTSHEHTSILIKDKFILRTIIQVGDTIKNQAYQQRESSHEILDKAQKELFEIAQDNIEKTFVPISQVLKDSFERISELHDNGVEFRGIPTGFADLDKVLGGLHSSDLLILAARPSMGKAQPLDTPVKTLAGWKQLGNLNIGDELASIDGKKSVVQGIFPQGKKQVFKITFADGRSTLCCDEHLWEVEYRDWEKARVFTTKQLQQKLTYKRYQNRLWIPVIKGKMNDEELTSLPIDPYLLGCLIGDGGLTHGTPMLSSKDDEILDSIRRILPSDLHLVHAGNYDYRISQKTHQQKGVSGVTQNSLTIALETLGLLGTLSHTKFLPLQYLDADYPSRLALLQGLMDTDGWVESFGAVRFCTVSEQLSKNVQALVRSFGGYCEIKTKNTSYVHNGVKQSGRLAYVLNIAGLGEIPVFRLLAKVNRHRKGSRNKRLNIVSIQPLDQEVEMACIKVSHPRELYVCNDYIVTHNTSLALELTKRIALQQKVGIAFFSLEMSRDQLVDKLISSASGIPLGKIRSGQLSDDPANNEFMKLGQAIGQLDQAPIWIDDNGSLNILELRTKARRLKSRYNIGFLVIDYLQLMSGKNTNYSGNRVQEVSDISRGLKMLAKELQIPILALSQLSRSVDSREDKRPMLSDLRESGSIEQDADIVMFVHREEMYHKETKKKNIGDILISKHRNGETGAIELAWVPRLATFDNLDGARLSRRVNE
jgi:replicative DNA helicase